MLSLFRPTIWLLFALILLPISALEQEPVNNVKIRAQVEAFLTGFHDAAAAADAEHYLGCFRKDAIIPGTAPGERFGIDSFRTMILEAFSGGRGSKTVPFEMNVQVSGDGRTAWFDERLRRESGMEMRATGVLRRGAKGWKIVQYNRAFPVPNDLIEFSIRGNSFTTPLEVAALRGDFALLRRTLEEWHPALYVYESKKAIDRMFEQTMAGIKKPMTALRFETFFARLDADGIGNLIVDLRNNPGDDPFHGAMLVSYLVDEAFTYLQFDRDENSTLDAMAMSKYVMARPPAEHHFKGKIFVLIGGRNTSTAGHVISVLKQQGRVVFIGQESGATWTCNDNSKDIILPATGIRVHIARTTYGAAVKGFAAGVSIQPDHEVHPTVEDMLAGRDPEMELALRLIREED